MFGRINFLRWKLFDYFSRLKMEQESEILTNLRSRLLLHCLCKADYSLRKIYFSTVIFVTREIVNQFE